MVCEHRGGLRSVSCVLRFNFYKNIIRQINTPHPNQPSLRKFLWEWQIPTEIFPPLNWNVGGNFCGNDKFPYSQYSHIFFSPKKWPTRNFQRAILSESNIKYVISNISYPIFDISQINPTT